MPHSSSPNSLSEGNMSGNEKLEDLLRKFSQEANHHEKSKILYTLVQTYLHHFKDELDTNVKSGEFLELLSQIPLLCEKFLQISESSCTDEIIIKKENLESASVCFQALLLCIESLYMTNQCVIIIKIALNVLSQGYTHCKESEIIYGDLLEQFANQLGAFFKVIEKLQTIVLQHLDKLDMTEYADNDIKINSVVVEMGNLCQIVFSLDADVAFEMWAKYLRLITLHKSLKYVSNINEISVYLASKNTDLLLNIKDIVTENSDMDEELAAKFFFYLDALSDLMNLSKDFSIENNLSFVSLLLECLLLSYSPFVTENSSLNIIKSSLKKNVFVLITHLCSNEEFLVSLPFLPRGVESHLSTIFLKLCSLQFVKNTSTELKETFFKEILSDILLDQDNYNMKMLYFSVPRCTVTETQSENLVTLYQLAYEAITELLKLMPDSFIENLESTILKALVSCSDVTFLLISDAWMYRLRCNTIGFLKERCYTVLQNLHKENVNNYKIEILLKRMLQFLPSPYKDPLLEAFSSLRFIEESKNIQHRYGIPDHTSTESEIKISSEEQIKMMISQLSENCTNGTVDLIRKACTCLELCTFFITVAGCSEISQFLELASELFKTNIYEIQIATLTFLKSLSKITMPEHNQEFGKIVAVLAQLFSETMHSKNYIVRYEARNIFSYFAKCTSHIKIVQETVKKDPSLKHILKSYMSAVPEDKFLSEKEKADYLQRQIFMQKNAKLEISSAAVESLQQLFSRANWRSLI